MKKFTTLVFTLIASIIAFNSCNDTKAYFQIKSGQYILQEKGVSVDQFYLCLSFYSINGSLEKASVTKDLIPLNGIMRTVFEGVKIYELNDNKYSNLTDLNGKYALIGESPKGDVDERSFSCTLKEENKIGELKVNEFDYNSDNKTITLKIDKPDNATYFGLYLQPIDSQIPSGSIILNTYNAISIYEEKEQTYTVPTQNLISLEFAFNEYIIYPLAVNSNTFPNIFSIGEGKKYIKKGNHLEPAENQDRQ